MEQTSGEAYAELANSGELGKRARAVITVLNQWPNSTQGEIAQRTGNDSDRKRLSELKKLEIVRQSGMRPCRITGRMAKTWALTGRPIPALGRKLNDEIVQKAARTLGPIEKKLTDGPTVFCAILDGVVLKAATGRKLIEEFGASTGVPMFEMKAKAVTRFPIGGTAAVFSDRDLGQDAKPKLKFKKDFENRELFPDHVEA